MKANKLEDWNEEIGSVLWWKFPIEEPPYIGTPLDYGQTVEVTISYFDGGQTIRHFVGGWPGYHTHWTPIEIPTEE